MSLQDTIVSLWDVLSSWLYFSSPSQCLQILFAIASCLVLSIAIAPSTERKLLMNYGARSSHGLTPADTPDKKYQGSSKDEENALHKIIKLLTSMGQVPHALFFTFYTTYLASAVFWAVQYFWDGTILHELALRQAKSNSPSWMTGGQLVIAWSLMVLQATRRLWECKMVMQPSKSTMWFAHWVMGLAFYCGVSVAVWIEGTGMVPAVVSTHVGC